jgi:hypothetical protein
MSEIVTRQMDGITVLDIPKSLNGHAQGQQ